MQCELKELYSLCMILDVVHNTELFEEPQPFSRKKEEFMIAQCCYTRLNCYGKRHYSFTFYG